MTDHWHDSVCPGCQESQRPRRQEAGRAVWCRTLGLAWLLTIMPAGFGTAQEASPAAAETARPFTRIYLPQDAIGSLQGPYLPVSRERFEALLQLANGPATGRQEARATDCQHELILQPNQTLAGKSTLRVQADSFPALLAQSWNVAIQQATWHDRDEDTVPLGLDSRGRQVAIVRQPGELQIEWSLLGHRLPTGEVEFFIEWPSSPRHELLLTAPENQLIQVLGGWAEKQSGTVATARWRILSSGEALKIIAAPASAGANDDRVIYDQLDEWDIKPSGLHGVSRVACQVVERELRSVTISLPVELDLVAVHLNGQVLDWTASLPAPNALDRTVTVFLQEAAAPGEHELLLTYVGASRQGWEALPRPSFPHWIWRRGRTKLHVHSPLILQELSLQGCRQVQVSAADDREGPSALSATTCSYEVVHDLLRSTISLQASLPRPRIRAAMASTISVGGPITTAQVVCQLWAISGQSFVLPLELHAPWSLDSMAVEPGDMLEDWSLEDGAEGRQRVTVRLTQPLSTDRRMQVQLSARRRRVGLGQRVRQADLRAVSLPDVALDAEWFAVRSRGSQQLRIQGDEGFMPLDPFQLPSQAAALIDSKRGDYVFQATHDPLNPRLTLTGGTPDWAAELQVDATVWGSSLQEVFEVVCQPRGSSLDQVLVQVTPPRKEPLRWTVARASARELPSRRWSAGELASAGYQGTEEVWEILLPETTASEIRLSASRLTSLAISSPTLAEISVLAAPRATQQRSIVNVHRTRDMIPDVVLDSEVPSLPRPADEGEVSSTAIGRFLVPAGPFSTSPIRLIRSAAAQLAPAWSWRTSTHCRIANSGACLFTTRWDIENRGRSDIGITLPPSAQLQKLEVDGNVRPYPAADDDRSVRISLPERRRQTSITVEYSLPRSPLARAGFLGLPTATADLPQLHRTTWLHLPRSYAVWYPLRQAMQLSKSYSLPTRFFGPRGPIQPSGWYHMPPADSTATTDPTSEDHALEAGDEYLVEVVSDKDMLLSVGVVDMRFVNALAWLVGTLLAAAAVFASRAHVAVWILVAGLGAALIPLVPIPAVPICRALLVGAVAGSLWRWVSDARQRKEAASTTSESGVARGLAVSSTRLVLLALLLTPVRFGLVAQAETPSAADSVEAQTAAPFTVVIPTDEGGQVASNYVLLPQTMYDQLIRYSSAAVPAYESWVFLDALYQGSVTLEDDGRSPHMEQVDGRLRFVTFQPGLTVRWPLSEKVVEQLQGPLQLDGESCAWQWQAQDGTLRWEVPHAGTHELRLRMRPRRGTPAGAGAWEFAVPPILRSRLELEIPLEMVEPEVRFRRGEQGILGNPHRVRAELGATERVALRWSGPIHKKPVAGERREWQQFSWLRVTPGAVTYEARFRPQGGDPAAPVALHLAVDPALSLLPLGASGGGLQELSEGSQQGTLHLTRAAGQEGDLRVQFLVKNQSGLGTIRLPTVRVLDDLVTQRWTAVSVDPQLSFERRISPSWPEIGSEQFAVAWDAAAALPDFALARPDPALPWFLKTYARQSNALANTALRICYYPDRMGLEFSANISPIEGQAFQHELAVPENFTVHAVAVDLADGSADMHWCQPAPGLLRIFLARPDGSPYRIEVVGETPIPAQSLHDIPSIRLLETTLTRVDVTLLRDLSVMLESLEVQGLQPKPFDPPIPELEMQPPLIPVAQLSGDGSQPPFLRASVMPNLPQGQGWMLLSVRPTDHQWQATVDYKATFQRGVPDLVSFEIPSNWGDGVTVDPPLQHRVVTLPDGRRRLILTPGLAPGSSALRLRITGPLTGGTPITAPVVIPLGPLSVSRWLRLPTEMDGQPLAWTLQRLLPSELPPELQFVGVQSSERVFRIVRDDAQATLRQVGAIASSPRVLLQELAWYVRPHGAFCTLRALVAPQGGQFVRLAVPQELELVTALMDDQPVRVLPAGGHYSVPLGGAHLPMQFTAICYLENSDPTKSVPRRLAIPRLMDHVVGPLGLTAYLPSGADLVCDRRALLADEAGLEQLRSEAIWEALKTPPMALSDYRPEDIHAWLDQWYPLAQRLLAEAGSVPDAAASVPEWLREALGTYSDRPRTAQLNSAAGITTAFDPDPLAGPSQAEQRRVIWGPSVEEPLVHYRYRGRRLSWTSWLVSLGCLLGSLIAAGMIATRGASKETSV